MYIERPTSSAFSFLDGASLPSALIERAAELGYPALALLDRDGLYGAPQFYRAAKAAGIKAIVGAELTIGYQEAAPSAPPCTATPAAAWRLPVLVASAEGYRNLCRTITQAKLRAPKGEACVLLDDFAGRTAGLVALVGREALCAERHGVGGLVARLTSLFGRDQVWIELQRHLGREDAGEIDTLLHLSEAFHVPVMASNGVRFASPEARPLYDVFTSLRHKTTLSRAGRLLSANAERYLKPPETMARLFSDLPRAIAGTEALAERLEFTLANLGYRFPEYPVPAGETEASFLRQIAEVGARNRYRPYHDAARAQIARELDLIERLGLAGYFLIVWDIVNFCREQRILVQGRGSAANSAVCYALGITAVDPVAMNLLFERFLSAERGEWPDIDLDLPSGDQRERVIQHVYKRYGALGAAMTANVISYRGRSATRELGKVLELGTDEVDRLARLMSQFEFVDPDETIARNLRESGLNPDDERYRQFARLWREMQDLPRHLGQHSGGMVICQGRLDEIVPLENASMPGRVVVQWDKDDCADLGIIKVDLLGLGMMAALEEAIAIINTSDDGLFEGKGQRAEGKGKVEGQRDEGQVEGEREEESGLASARSSPLPSAPCPLPYAQRIDLAHLPPDDPAVYRMLQTADTVGLFQVESRAQMATLPRLKPTHFYDIVVEVAIIRPGPIVGNMVHPYLARRRGDEPVTFAHPLLEPVLGRTLGVPLFQEQLIKMAMVVAGFTGGEAEELRRAMGFKRSVKRMQQIEGRLRDGMAQNGITGAAADQIVQSITSFALYGFPESHAASFALIVYASAYLKAHFPAAFYTALLNNQPMGFYSPATLVKDAQRRGVRFAPVDVMTSTWSCAIESSGAIRLGLRYVKGLSQLSGQRIERAEGKGQRAKGRDEGAKGRAEGGREKGQYVGRDFSPAEEEPRFRSIEDLVLRTGLGQDEVRALAESGALAAFGGDRRTALWQAEHAGRPAGPLLEDLEAESKDTPSSSPLPLMSLAERVQADYDRTGLTIGPHPMALVRRSLASRGVMRAIDLLRERPGRRVRVAGAVITRQRPGTAKGFVFLSLEDETGIANAIVTPAVFATCKRTIVDEPYLLIQGVLQNQDGAVSVKADAIEPLQHDGPSIDSRDFH